jgi:hypothetical protein
MSVFAGIRRQWDLRPNRPLNLAGFPARGRPEASSGQPRGRREPHGAAGIQRNAYLAIAEALQDGADVVPASDEVGRRLAEEGVSLLEALDGLGALYRSIAGASRLLRRYAHSVPAGPIRHCCICTHGPVRTP